MIKEARESDPLGDYVRRWLPELKDVPVELLHVPWTMTELQQAEFNVRLGVDYPQPIVPPNKFRDKKIEERIRLAKKFRFKTSRRKR
jgi:deoxyribodipyrimidine photo-lyase